jgi:hypothetical protein
MIAYSVMPAESSPVASTAGGGRSILRGVESGDGVGNRGVSVQHEVGVRNSHSVRAARTGVGARAAGAHPQQSQATSAARDMSISRSSNGIGSPERKMPASAWPG